MGRKSLAEQRCTDILEAFERCIEKYGFAESSLERVAEEAGKSRNIIRHYIGNRDQLIATYVRHVVDKLRLMATEISTTFPKEQLIPYVLDYLFWEHIDDEEDDPVGRTISGLWQAKQNNRAAQQILLDFYRDFEDIFTQGLAQLYPRARPAQCLVVAYAIICLAESNWVLLDLGITRSHNKMARQSVETLLRSLEE
jgi:AcrR family transcriptional regulator